MYKLFELFDRQYMGIDDEQKRFMNDEQLLPYLILAEWVTDVCSLLDNYSVTRMANLFTALDRDYDGFHQCRRALEEQASGQSPQEIIRASLENLYN